MQHLSTSLREYLTDRLATAQAISLISVNTPKTVISGKYNCYDNQWMVCLEYHFGGAAPGFRGLGEPQKQAARV